MARWLLTLLGVLLILIALRDIVPELFLMDAVGSVSRLVVGGLWYALRQIGKRFRSAFGWKSCAPALHHRVDML